MRTAELKKMSAPSIVQTWLQKPSLPVYLPEEEIQMAAKCVERCSTLLLLGNKNKVIPIFPHKNDKTLPRVRGDQYSGTYMVEL